MAIFSYSVGTCQNNMSRLEDNEIEYELVSSQNVPTILQMAVLSVQTLRGGKDHKMYISTSSAQPLGPSLKA